jgi:hypothetical protein
MNKTTRQPTTTPTWGQPGYRPEGPPKAQLRWLAPVVIGGIILVAIIANLAGSKPSNPGGSFYASPGWTITRAADLSVKIEYDDGISRPRADCAMKTIVGGTTWLEWQTIGSAGQLGAIRAAEAAC